MEITTKFVKCLVKEQFPKWQHLAIQPVDQSGHDNRTFHLGKEYSVRLPSGVAYAGQVTKEAQWLPKLQGGLSYEIPVPVALGKPTAPFPFPWSINRWIDGQTVSVQTVPDRLVFAHDLARFLNELQQIDVTGGPLAGKQNFYRGGALKVYHQETRQALTKLSSVFPAKPLQEIWERALASHWQQPPVWVHGDLAVGNLLVRDGRLVAVIDFGILGIGDPACDYVMAWTFFEQSSREIFKKSLACDEATWERSKGWALWKALISYQSEEPESTNSQWASQTIHELLADSFSS
ncbi:aminoglycoside phosphotransferase family protein [Enterococcus sp. LJL98]